MASIGMRESRASLGWPWWVFLITGLAWIFISIIVLQFNYVSVATVGYLLGVMFAAAAINEFLVMGMVDGWRWLHAILGVAFALGAIYSFISPRDTFLALASVLGFLLVLMGTFYVMASVASRPVNPLWGLGLAAGILEILLGFWAAQRYYPARASLILIWVGFMAMFRGIGEIVMAFRVRQLQEG
jgi:uncharacterized membrane protein HdeD (DUF308 family)